MPSYRPITDVIICARPKVKYYGAYPAGFLRRAKWLMPGRMLHLCGGLSRQDLFFGPTDKTVDIRDDVGAHIVADARKTGLAPNIWDAVLADPPYTDADAEHYGTGCPVLSDVLKEAHRLTRPGGRYGSLHYLIPRPADKGDTLIAVCGVMMGFGNRMRALTVFQKGGEPRAVQP